MCVMVITLVTNQHAFDQTITGTAKVKLTGPITQEQMDQCKEDAKYRLKPQVLRWLDEQKNLRINTTDLLTNLLLNSFLDSCITRAHREFCIQGKILDILLQPGPGRDKRRPFRF